MRILFSIDTFASGGKERMLMELMKALRKRPGIEFELIVMSDAIHFKEVFDLEIVIHQVIRKTKKDLSVFRKVYTICKKYNPDLVHCWDSMSPVYLIPALKYLNIKLVNGMVTDAPSKTGFSNKHWVRARLTFPFSSIIIGNCQAGLTAYNAPESKSVCIHNGFDFERTKTLIPAGAVSEQIGIKTKYVVGMVASYSLYKDYATFFAAANILLKKRRDITFLAIGRGTDSKDAQHLLKSDFKQYFKLLGTRSGVESLINIMDVCVLATFTEGISNSIMEYMALSKPVIATAGGGTNEILEDNITGFLVSAMNPVELSQRLDLLLNDEDLRMKMGIAGKLRVCNDFTIDKMVDEFVMSYERVIA